jgi:hypothetical protein
VKEIRGINYNWANEKTIDESLVVCKNMPSFMGCVEDDDSENDFVSDLEFGICSKTGTIQSLNRLSHEFVYIKPHNYCVGKTWNDHHEAFSNYILQNVNKDSVVWEIGGADGNIAKRCIDSVKEWHIIEPNKPQYAFEHEKITYHSGYYPEVKISNADLVVHSQLFEHIRDPINFLRDINCDNQIFSLPDFDYGMMAGFPSIISFEHEQVLDNDTMHNLLLSCGYSYEKINFNNFSYFYKINRTHEPSSFSPVDESKSRELLLTWHSVLENQALEFQSKLSEINQTHNVYFFGAHIFYTILRSLGLEYSFTSLLDNSPLKIGKRFYGSKLYVNHPEILKNIDDAIVVVPKVIYSKEMVEQLNSINKNIRIILSL